MMEVRLVWSSKECVCCACDPSMHLDVLSTGCVCRKLSLHLGVFALLMLLLCVILHTMCSVKSLQLLCLFNV